MTYNVVNTPMADEHTEVIVLILTAYGHYADK